MSPFDEQAPETVAAAPIAPPKPAVPPLTPEQHAALDELCFPSDRLRRDTHPQLLVTRDEVIHLATGQRKPLAPTDRPFRRTAVAAGGECPLWRRFLGDVTEGDEDLEDYLQRMAGYCLTGSTAENALFFLHGPGANGKTVFANTLAEVMGGYARTVPTATLLAGRRHGPADLKSLAAARLLTARETEEGERWAEARIKALTGGDPVADKTRAELVEFTPRFKLLVVGNYKPGLKNVDVAIRRRIHVIPFRAVIPPEDRDRHMADKLAGESRGILQWMVEGAREWWHVGLAMPAAVRDATADYLDGEDHVGQWIAACCTRDEAATATSADLFASWCRWAERTRHPAGSQRRLSEALEAGGFRHTRLERGARGFLGIVVNEAVDKISC